MNLDNFPNWASTDFDARNMRNDSGQAKLFNRWQRSPDSQFNIQLYILSVNINWSANVINGSHHLVVIPYFGHC